MVLNNMGWHATMSELQFTYTTSGNEVAMKCGQEKLGHALLCQGIITYYNKS